MFVWINSKLHVLCDNCYRRLTDDAFNVVMHHTAACPKCGKGES